MRVVFFLNKLHETVRAQDYERWVREVDYPTAKSIPSILDYKVAKIEGLLEVTIGHPMTTLNAWRLPISRATGVTLQTRLWTSSSRRGWRASRTPSLSTEPSWSNEGGPRWTSAGRLRW